MSDNTNSAQEQAQNVTELKPKRTLDIKKYAKYAAYGTAVVLSAVVIFKLASEPEQPQPETLEPASEVNENVA